MTKADALKKIRNLVDEDKIREAKEIAREYNVEFDLAKIILESKTMFFIFNKRR